MSPEVQSNFRLKHCLPISFQLDRDIHAVFIRPTAGQGVVGAADDEFASLAGSPKSLLEIGNGRIDVKVIVDLVERVEGREKS